MSFELTILGSNSALPTSNRYSTAQVLNVLGQFFLIDCGEGTQMQLRKNRIGFSKIDHILISHTHGDHIFGLIGLISSLILLGRKKDLHIYSHSELQRYIQFQLDFLYMQEMPFQVIFHPLNFKSPSVIFENKKVSITSFPLKHRIPTCGFYFKEKPALPNLIKEKLDHYHIPIRNRQKIKEGEDYTTPDGTIIPNSELVTAPKNPRTFAFCSDTAYHEAIIDTIKDVDLLYHEATFAKDKIALAEETFHSTSQQAGKIAKLANAKKLLIGHFSSRYKTPDQLLEEAHEIFPETYAVNDNDVFSVKSK